MTPEAINNLKDFKNQMLDATSKQYGDAAAAFMNIVYTQNAQNDIVLNLISLARSAKNIGEQKSDELISDVLQSFAQAQAQVTQLAATITDMTEANALEVFNKANEVYEQIHSQISAPEKTND